MLSINHQLADEVPMKFGRISMLEFSSADNVAKFVEHHRKKSHLLGAESHFITQTGEASAMVLSIYSAEPSDEKVAEDLELKRQKYKASADQLLKDYFFYEGELVLHMHDSGNESVTDSNFDSKSELQSMKAEILELKKLIHQLSAKIET